MKRTVKSALVFALTASMVLGNAGVSEAAKKPKLSKTKATIYVGKTQKITVKKAKPKKTTWSVNKKGKKIVSLTKKKKTSVVLKGKKAGKATVTAKIKVGKKTYKKTVKVTVKKKKTTNTNSNTNTNSATPTPGVTATPTPGVTATPTAPASNDPTPTATPLVTNDVTVELSSETEYAKGGIDEEAGVTYENGGAEFVGLVPYSGGGVMWYASKDQKALDLSHYEQIIFNVSVDIPGTPIVLAAVHDENPRFYEANTTPTYSEIQEANTPTEVVMDLSNITEPKDFYAVMVKYNTWTPDDSFEGDAVTFKVHSIKLIAKPESEWPTATPEATPTPTPTATPTATPDAGEATPTPEAPVGDVALDLSKVTGTGAAYDAEKGAIVAADCPVFHVPLDKEVAAGETVKVRVKGTAGSLPFRTWLNKDAVDVATSNQLNSSTDGNVVAGEFTWEYELTASAVSSHIEFKGVQYGTNIDTLEITSIEILSDAPVATATPEPTAEPTATPEPVVIEATDKINVKFNEKTNMDQGSTSNCVYNADGSVSYTAHTQYSGGGIVWALNEDKTSIPLSELSSVTIRIKAEGQVETEPVTPIVLVPVAEGGSFWETKFEMTKDNYNHYGQTTDEYTTFTYDFSNVTNQNQKLAGVCMKYNAYNFAGGDVTMTIESIVLTKKSLSYENLDADTDYVITSDGETSDLTASDLAQISKVMDTDNVYSKWTSNQAEFVKTLESGREITAIADETDPAKRTILISDAEDTVRQYSATIAETAEGIALTVQAKDSDKVYDIAVANDTINVALEGTNLVKLAKNADGTYTIDVNKEEAAKRGIVLAKR